MRRVILWCSLVLMALLSLNTVSAQQNVVWRAEYFSNLDFTPPATITSYETTINYNWGIGAPAPGLPADGFSVRWFTNAYFQAGVYRFTALADDEIRIYIDNNTLLLDTFNSNRPGLTVASEITLTEGYHTVQVDYRERFGAALVQVGWEFVRPATAPDLVNATWVAEYYNNPGLAGVPAAIFSVPTPTNDWGAGAPFPSISPDGFSARFSTTVRLNGSYDIQVSADDGVRVYVNNTTVIDEWHDARPELYNATITLPEGDHTIVVEYYEGSGLAFLNFQIRPIEAQLGNWAVEYFSNPNLAGAPVLSNIVATPTSNWGFESPSASIPVNNFSARWTSRQQFEQGTYRLSLQADDGVRAYVDGQRVIDEWHLASASTYTVDIPLTAGNHLIVIEYFESGGLAFLTYDLRRVGDYVAQPPGTPVVPSGAFATITTDRLNVRSQPTTDGEIIARVFSGENYPVLGRTAESTWWQIQLDATTSGWVFFRFVNIDNPGIVPVTAESAIPDVVPTPYTLIALADVNIRSSASSRSALLGDLPRGRSAQIIARNARTSWWYIQYGNIVGWVSGEFIQLPRDVDLSQVPVR